MKILGRLFILAVAAFCLLMACDRPEVKEPVKIRLNKELMSNLRVGETQKLEASVTPHDAEVTLVWSSDNESVAVVDDEGNVTGVATGTTEVSVQADDAVAKCKVVVLALAPKGIRLNVENLDLAIGQTFRLEAVLTPEGASADDIQWISSKESVATVKDGMVTAVSEGKCVITVSCNEGFITAECEVTVTKDAEEKVLVSSIDMLSALELKVGNSYVMNVKVHPENATDKSVTFTCDGDCINVDENTGVVEAVKEGTATVTATANDGSGVKAECNVKVSVEEIIGGITGVAITAEDDATDVQVGKGLQLYAQCIPAEAKPNSISWTVDNPSLAVVDQNGVLTGVEATKASGNEWSKVVVTVNADGAQASLSFRVIPLQPEGLSMNLPERPLKINEAWDLCPRIIPDELNEKYQLDPTMGTPVYGGIFKSSQPGSIGIGFYISDSYEDVVYRFVRYYAIEVEPYWVKSISLPARQEMELGALMNMTPSFTSDVDGVEPTYKDVKWTSSDPSIVSVDEKTGEIKANAAGTAEITATTCNDWSVPSGESQKSATCAVTVKSSDNAFNIGDYYYSDGTWSKELKTDKTVIGVIFAKANATTSDPVLARDFPEATHGLVVSTVEYADQDFGSVSAYNGHGYYNEIGYDANLIVDEDKPNGYGNTLAHKDLNAARPDYCLLFNSADGVVAQHAAAVSVPATASSWYIPSYKEMSMINQNREVINAAIAAVGGTPLAEPYEREESFDDKHSSDWYWTSTIKGNWYDKGKTYDHFKYPYDISKGTWTTYQQNTGKFKVRVILAF